MSNQALGLAWRAIIESPAQKNVLVVLADHANQDFEAYPSIQTMVDYTAFSERTVRTALRDLEASGWVEREERIDRKTGRMKTALYRLIFTDTPDRMRPEKVRPHAKEGATVAPNPLLRTLNEERTPIIPSGNQGLPGIDAPPKKHGKPKPEPFDPMPHSEAWNVICGRGKIPKVLVVTDPRRNALEARIKQLGGTPEDWIKFCKRVSRAPWLIGADGDWNADFDWCLKPANFLKIIEGNYDPKGHNSGNREARFEASPGTI